MKKIVIIMIGIMVFTSCKKSEVKPMEEPTQAPVATCKSGLKLFTGIYELNNANKDTIEIVFLSDNCPEDNSNNYAIKRLSKALILFTNPQIEDKDYIVKSNEITKQAVTSDNMYKITLQQNYLILQSPNLNLPQIQFKKL